MLSVAQIIQHQMTGEYEQERTCNDWLWPNLRYYSGHILGGTEEHHKKLVF